MGYEAFIQNVLNIEEGRMARHAARDSAVEQARMARQGMRDSDLWLLQVIELAVEYYWEQDAQQRFTCVLFSSRVSGRDSAGEYLGRTFWELDGDPANGTWERFRALCAAREPIRRFVIWRHDPARGSQYLAIEGRARFDEAGSFIGYCGVVRDVTLEKQTEDHAESLELAAVGIGHVADGGRFIHANRKLCEMLGYSREELQKLTVKEISHPDDADVADVARSGLRSGSLASFHCEKRYIRKDGRPIWVGLTISTRRDVHGHPLYDVSIVEDISARKDAEARVQYLATHDEMTGLANRALFNQLLKHAFETGRRYSRTFALLFIDLDRFKQINDSLGHTGGDLLLKETATRLLGCVRSSDVVARLGGDEFVVLVQEIAGKQQVAAIARNILAATLKPQQIHGQECRVTASIGISLFPGDGGDEQLLMKNADTAMYQAKEEGKNNFQFYSAALKTHAVEKLALEAHLRHAVDRNEFDVYYQAKVSIRTGEIRGVEALLRWHNAALGHVSPAQFIPLSEETGLIIPVGRWVIRKACEQIRNWNGQALPPVCISVNLSPRQFSDPELLPFIKGTLADTGIDPQRLELEITESMVMHHPERALRKLNEIKALGIRIAIDDFGTGYSSLSQLKRFPVDTLKVDRSFIREIQTHEEDRAITQAIITMGKTLGLTVVAEGVETAEQQSFLSAHACDEIQGYYFSKPIPCEDFERLLRTHRPVPLQ
ncbi:MAG: putative bifunctional diguanylate cyclase/phosphodiesterase [Gammaproteobacteria bacterium]